MLTILREQNKAYNIIYTYVHNIVYMTYSELLKEYNVHNSHKKKNK